MSPPLNITEYNIGGRLIPRAVVEFNASAFTDALWDILHQGGVISGITVNATLNNNSNNNNNRSTKIENAVHPAWRTAAANIVVALYVLFPSSSIFYNVVNSTTLTNHIHVK